MFFATAWEVKMKDSQNSKYSSSFKIEAFMLSSEQVEASACTK